MLAFDAAVVAPSPGVAREGRRAAPFLLMQLAACSPLRSTRSAPGRLLIAISAPLVGQQAGCDEALEQAARWWRSRGFACVQ